jgi:hypothetical protein
VVSTPPAAPKHPAAGLKVKAKAKAKARHVAPAKPKAKPVVHTKKPTVARPLVPATSTRTGSLPADVPPADSGSGFSTRSVLLITFVVAIGAGVFALLVGAGWRRLWWWRRYHAYQRVGREVQSRPVMSDEQRTNGVVADDVEPVTVVTRRGVDAPTGT